MMKNLFLACAILHSLSICFLKGENLLQTADLLPTSENLFLKQPLTGNNLLEQDDFYQKTLPKILDFSFKPKGEYRTAFFAIPNNFHPFSNDPFVSSLWELCTGSLSQLKVGQYETMAPFLAESIIEEKKENEICYHVTLKENLFWEDFDFVSAYYKDLDIDHFKKRKVTARDFKFYIEVIKNPFVDLPKAVALRDAYRDLKEIKITSLKSFVVIWQVKEKAPYNIKYLTGQLRPLPEHIYSYWPSGERILSDEDQSQYLFAKHFCNHWAKHQIPSCGPWVFKKFDQNLIELHRNESFPDSFAALLNKMVFIHKSSGVSAWQAFKNKELTSCYLSASQMDDFENFLKSPLYLKQAKEGSEVKKLEYFSKLYYFIGWNQKNPLFQSKEVRYALSLSINQNQIIEHFLKGNAKALSGPFIPGTSSYDDSILPTEYDPKKAIEILENQGWHLSEVGGVRRKIEAKREYVLRFHLSYFLHNENAQAICQYIATSLKEIGVECLLQGLDYAEFMSRYQNKNFDALYMGWALSSPPENPRPCWHSQEAEKIGSSNIIGFQDEEVDFAIDELTYCQDKEKRKKLYHKIHKRIHDLSPYTFLFVPKQFFIYRSELKNVMIPKNSDLFTNANLEEVCLKIFYIDK